MKTIWLFILLASFFGGSIQTISLTNRYVREAAAAYAQQDYEYAIAAYEYLLNKLEVEDDQIRLNLAHAYYRATNYDKARKHYQPLSKHESLRIRALATLQLGNIAFLQKNYKKALALYRAALIAEPGNENARYNFELLKKYLEQHPELNQEAEEAPQPPLVPEPLEPDNIMPPPSDEAEEAPAPKKSPDPQGSEQEETDSREQADDGTIEGKAGTSNAQDRQQENRQLGDTPKKEATGSTPGDTLGQNPETSNGNGQSQNTANEPLSEADQRAQTQRARLQQMNLTPEKAQLLLDAMRNAELQYIQQLPRKSTRKPDRSRPDW